MAQALDTNQTQAGADAANQTMRRCSKCKGYRPESEFDSENRQCRKHNRVDREKKRADKRKKRLLERVGPGDRYCAQCKKIQPEMDFALKPDGSRNSQCSRHYVKKRTPAPHIKPTSNHPPPALHPLVDATLSPKDPPVNPHQGRPAASILEERKLQIEEDIRQAIEKGIDNIGALAETGASAILGRLSKGREGSKHCLYSEWEAREAVEAPADSIILATMEDAEKIMRQAPLRMPILVCREVRNPPPYLETIDQYLRDTQIFPFITVQDYEGGVKASTSKKKNSNSIMGPRAMPKAEFKGSVPNPEPECFSRIESLQLLTKFSGSGWGGKGAPSADLTDARSFGLLAKLGSWSMPHVDRHANCPHQYPRPISESLRAEIQSSAIGTQSGSKNYHKPRSLAKSKPLSSTGSEEESGEFKRWKEAYANAPAIKPIAIKIRAGDLLIQPSGKLRTVWLWAASRLDWAHTRFALHGETRLKVIVAYVEEPCARRRKCARDGKSGARPPLLLAPAARRSVRPTERRAGTPMATSAPRPDPSTPPAAPARGRTRKLTAKRLEAQQARQIRTTALRAVPREMEHQRTTDGRTKSRTMNRCLFPPDARPSRRGKHTTAL
ncbi:hypothetical protein BU26DRAFT_553692 [Trematosphaeria pertusa]|uniref:Uncharacterized protein n=1 Tax=Trematosphaeria pertusa TaxID=390896 RepID=A0A6A6I4R0_9PLEO|nr:uncharacterized protein BU26DRAFT_553692 [Trematosphaeria pertusa]KAF2245209.1 hypothetical protein BU26DRAFT_553692 [Trematosphaeria pertusa]